MERKIAYVGKIIDIQPIKGADFIVSAVVICGSGGKWSGTIPKDQFEIGELVDVYLQDAILPDLPEFDFMEKYHRRVSMKKFKKVPSECLIWKSKRKLAKVGDIILGIKKYDKPVPAQLAGVAYGLFPTNVLPKTDEPNFQGVPEMIEALKGQKFYSTVKADGSSGTIYKTNDHFGVCSRNLELKDTEGNSFWRLAHKYDLINKLPNDYAIQFETIGPGIQKNRLELSEIDMRVFNVWDCKKRCYLDAEDAFQFCKDIGVPTVEIVDWNETFNFDTDEQLRKKAEDKYKGTKNDREGLVFRPMKETMVNGERLSFKVINLNYKD
jgi:RNA ligase (TIGR02306 family)